MPRLFTGRQLELDRLAAMLADARNKDHVLIISAITGAGGVGKTWLAVQWAHEHIDRFPDGQLFVDLRGFDPSGEPMPSAVALRVFLNGLGVAPMGIPPDLDAQIGLYRSLVAEKKMLIVLDNAFDAMQVVPLLPGNSACTVLITSRRSLAGLVSTHGARSLELDVLSASEAEELIALGIGQDRIAREPVAVTELLNWCSGSPLALSIVTARATTHPGFPLAALAEELRDESFRLDGLYSDDQYSDLRAVLSWSQKSLTPTQSAMFALLGPAFGPDISLEAAAHMTNQPIRVVRAQLRALEDVRLIQQHAPNRFRMHDLIRLYSVEKAKETLDVDVRHEAMQRLVNYYVQTTYASRLQLRSHDVPLGLDVDLYHDTSPFEEQASALAWLDANHACLLATVHGVAEDPRLYGLFQLAWSIDPFHYGRGHIHDRISTWQLALSMAERQGDSRLSGIARRYLGRSLSRAGMNQEALSCLQHALVLAHESNDVIGQADTHDAFAGAWEHEGDDQEALAHAGHALQLFRELGLEALEARSLNDLGWFHARLHNDEQARTNCERALVLFRRNKDAEGQADTLDSLGYIEYQAGNSSKAVKYYQEAIVLQREIDYTYAEADTSERLGLAFVALGQIDQAIAAWRRAFKLYGAQRRPADQNRVLDSLNRIQDPPAGPVTG